MIPATQHVRGSNYCHIGVFADRIAGPRHRRLGDRQSGEGFGRPGAAELQSDVRLRRDAWARAAAAISLGSARPWRDLGHAIPAPKRNQRPNRLDDAERPSALQKAVNRSGDTGAGEGEHEPRAAMLEGIEQEHGGDRQQARTASAHPSASARWGRQSLARHRIRAHPRSPSGCRSPDRGPASWGPTVWRATPPSPATTSPASPPPSSSIPRAMAQAPRSRTDISS